MIKRLKKRFIGLAMAALFVVLAVSVTAMNALNYSSVVTKADEILDVLSRNRGSFPNMDKPNGGREPSFDQNHEPNFPDDLPKHMSPETPYEARFFSVFVSSDGETVRADTGRIAAVDAEQAEDYAKSVLALNKTAGFFGNYRYRKAVEENGVRIIFVDCGRDFDGFYRYLWISIGITLGGLAVMFVIIVFFAGRIVRPIAESYEKQKRFITDAGHEIKTPLTIINANVDLLETDPDDADCLRDIRTQAERLTELTNDLVFLARMEEADRPLEMSDIAVSDIISETVSAFHAIAQTQNKQLNIHIQPALFMKGSDKTFRQLIEILMDNALKYSPDGGTVDITFRREKHTLQLNFGNATEQPVQSEELPRVFDRFYRMDKSRNSATGGHGIGLSSAKAIVEAHRGKIHAWTTDGNSFNITCIFPC